MNLTAIMALTLAALTSEYSVAEAQLRELVVTDPLTGLPNYRCLVEVLGTEITRANRTDRPFAVVFFDMDGLKSIERARPPDWQPGRVPVCRNPARVVPRDRHRRAAWAATSSWPCCRTPTRKAPRSSSAGWPNASRRTRTSRNCRRARAWRFTARRRNADDAPERSRSRPLRRQGGQGGGAPSGRGRDSRLEQRRVAVGACGRRSLGEGEADRQRHAPRRLLGDDAPRLSGTRSCSRRSLPSISGWASSA